MVIDAQINSDRVEMYADPSARGGVLEPEGIVEIKFRVPELLQAMHRIDPIIASLKVCNSWHMQKLGPRACSSAATNNWHVAFHIS